MTDSPTKPRRFWATRLLPYVAMAMVVFSLWRWNVLSFLACGVTLLLLIFTELRIIRDRLPGGGERD